VLLFNHGPQAARVELDLPLARTPKVIRDVVTGTTVAPGGAGLAGASFRLDTEIPGERARVYRINY
jgi:hypothetical protein